MKGEFEKSSDAPKDIFEKVGLYGKGIVKDPANTLRALFTEEQLRKLTNNAAVFERKNFLSLLDKGDKNTDVDHIIPLSLGGSNSEKNLQVLDKETKAKKDRVEKHLWKLLSDGEIDKKEAVRRVKNWEEEYKKL